MVVVAIVGRVVYIIVVVHTLMLVSFL